MGSFCGGAPRVETPDPCGREPVAAPPCSLARRCRPIRCPREKPRGVARCPPDVKRQRAASAARCAQTRFSVAPAVAAVAAATTAAAAAARLAGLGLVDGEGPPVVLLA